MPADPEVKAALEQIAGTVQTLGAEIRDVRLPSLEEFAAVNRVILQSEAWAIHGAWLRERPGDYGQLARRRLMAGAFMGAGDYVHASRRRLGMMAAVEDVLRQASAGHPGGALDSRASMSSDQREAGEEGRPQYVPCQFKSKIVSGSTRSLDWPEIRQGGQLLSHS
jgi:aspartyl-tRNA(Asn)/glutamyl-tRNA(Gln) amidotransferase subunit A